MKYHSAILNGSLNSIRGRRTDMRNLAQLLAERLIVATPRWICSTT